MELTEAQAHEVQIRANLRTKAAETERLNKDLEAAKENAAEQKRSAESTARRRSSSLSRPGRAAIQFGHEGGRSSKLPGDRSPGCRTVPAIDRGPNNGAALDDSNIH